MVGRLTILIVVGVQNVRGGHVGFPWARCPPWNRSPGSRDRGIVSSCGTSHMDPGQDMQGVERGVTKQIIFGTHFIYDIVYENLNDHRKSIL